MGCEKSTKLLSLQPGIVYGPQRSRRLGASLGVNLLPTRTKLCTLDCRYCQYGWTNLCNLDRIAELELPTAAEVAAAVATALQGLAQPPAFLTFSGNGEATLHPAFAEIVEALLEVRARRAPSAKLAILSNSTHATDERVRAALAKLDVRIMKLDVGREATFQRYNHPAPGIRLADVVASLRSMVDVTLQALFAGGPGGNADAEEIAAWVEQVVTIRPDAVQIYSLDRGWPADDLTPLSRGDLTAIRERLELRGVRADVF